MISFDSAQYLSVKYKPIL